MQFASELQALLASEEETSVWEDQRSWRQDRRPGDLCKNSGQTQGLGQSLKDQQMCVHTNQESTGMHTSFNEV